MSSKERASFDQGDGTSVSARNTNKDFWLLRMVLPGARGRWLTAALISGSLMITFVLFGGLFGINPAAVSQTSDDIVIFFCLILGYIVPIHHLITARSLTALGQLEASGNLPPAQHQASRRRILHKSLRWNFGVLGLGLLAGISHNLLLIDAAGVALQWRTVSLLPILTTTLVWVMMMAVISSLVDNALVFKRMARTISIDLLNVRTLTPFGSVAVSSTLAIIGAQALFPLMALESNLETVIFLPGIIATTIPMILIFVLPIWPVHKLVVARKRAELDRISREISQLSQPDGSDPRTYTALNPLLVYRQEIATVSEWPFDTSVISRLALYLIIPPLTWVGAALIEILIDTAI